MPITTFPSPTKFNSYVGSFLLDREAENCVLLGLIARAIALPPERQSELPTMLAIDDDAGQCVGVGTITPSRPLLLSRMSSDLTAGVADDLSGRDLRLQGVTAPGDTAETFARQWSERTGIGYRLIMGLGTYQLDQVIPPRPTAGELRAAGLDDLPLLDVWEENFSIEAATDVPPPEVRRANLARRIDEGTIFVWCDPADGSPVSMVASAAPTPNGMRISLVYTPPDQRGRGYASAAVATLSQQLLDSGRKFCFLNTDLANPTSNRIYQAIGYRHVCDGRQYAFE